MGGKPTASVHPELASFAPILRGPCLGTNPTISGWTPGDLCITPWNGLHELFGVPIWAKRTAHASGQIANCLRLLGRV